MSAVDEIRRDEAKRHDVLSRITPQGEKTRAMILRVAMDIASLEGLSGLTIGKLSDAVGMSKSGLFAHFGSKEELQLATVDAARVLFVEQVLKPAQSAERGISRVLKLVESWGEYSVSGTWPGGCFFAQAAADFDGRPGIVRDRIADVMREWLSTVERVTREAIEMGQLSPTLDPEQFAFECNGLSLGANWSRQLLGDERATAKALAAIRSRIAAAAIGEGRPRMQVA